MGKIIGIDLGTTNSCVAVMESGEPTVVQNSEGQRTTPSIVAFTDKGRLVGQPAKNQMVTNPERTVYSIKRFMGRRFIEVPEEIKMVPYRVTDSGNDVRVHIDDNRYSPPEISAAVLQKMKETAESYLGETVTEAVITVPAYFNDSQRQATKDAGRIAGLDVKRIVNDGAAAALAYGLNKEGSSEEKIAVYDLGGGTFDISILELGDGVFEVKSTNGDTHLGGDNFDQRVIDWLITSFRNDNGIDLSNDRMALQRLKEQAEKAKIELSGTQSTEINLPFITADSSGPKHLQYTLTRAKFEQMIDDLVQQTRRPCEQAIKDAGVSANEIDQVILVGGSTRIPAVQQLVAELFGKDPNRGVNPDEVVAVGAAIQGGILGGDVKDVLLMDVTPLSLGIETLGQVSTRLIERNTNIPTRKSQIFSVPELPAAGRPTPADNQTAVSIHVLQGEREMAAQNRTLGRFDLADIPAAPRGVPQIEVAFDIDANGIVHVSAKDLDTGKEQRIRIESSSGLSEDEIERMVKDAEVHADEDKNAREAAEARNEADSLIYATEKSLNDFGDKVGAEDKEKISAAIADLKQAVDGNDTAAVKAKIEALNQASQKLAEEVYRDAQQKASKYDALARAATDAVEGSRDEMKKVTRRVGCLTDLLKDTADAVRPTKQAMSKKDPCVLLISEIDRFVDQVNKLLERQWEASKTFNIVLFGRTGVGKSTLISAMTGSDGASVSQGESDWTTAVEPVDWHSCRLYDTPGINGWGRTESREDLERRAQEAVEVADFVLVCFDSQSQQAGEFEKLAAWVHLYRKPVIAVLNPRNPRWRLPPRVTARSARANLSRAVREHAGNIRDELAKIGLTGVPVTALSLKRALFARAALPFNGPDGPSLANQRKAFGADVLERWSGYSTLEGLLVRSVREHAVKLRIGALNDHLRGVILELKRAIESREREAAKAADTIESRLVAPLLRLLGYPDDHSSRQPFRDDDNRDLLAELERSRGGVFQGPVKGEFRQFVAQRLDTELGALRMQSLQKAEECVIGAFERRVDISADDVRKAAFAENEMRGKAESVLREGAEFLERHVKLAIRDTRLDLQVLHSRTIRDIEGKAGIGWKHSAWALKGGGILLGVASALGAFALANFWNPLGLLSAAAGVVLVVGGVLSMAFGWLGSKAREKGERQRLAARREALAKVRRNVHEVYDRVTEEVSKQARSQALTASREVLRGSVESALTSRTVQTHCRNLRANIASLFSDLPTTAEPQSLLWKVATTIERDAYPGRPDAAMMHWLGEDWIDDPEGLKTAYESTDAGRAADYDPTIFESVFKGMRDIFDRIADDAPDRRSGRTWLTIALERCKKDADAVACLKELQPIADSGKPRIHLVGDYSAGKTSFIKRLLIDAGLRVPETMHVGGDPTTNTPREYDWDGITLIDNPGFQSSNSAHDENALRALSDASAVLYLFQPNLIVGDDEYMTTVLRGSKERGMVPRQNHTFFVVNRSDELGVDPDDAPDAFRQLVQRKQMELSLALSSRSVTVTPDRVFCMASDPYGLVGDSIDVDASAFDPYRNWDGFSIFSVNFRRVKGKLLRSGCDRSILGGGLARLANLKDRQRSVVAKLKKQDAALASLQKQIDESIAEGTRLGAKHRAELERLVSEHAAGFADEVLSAQDPENLKINVDRLKTWWNDKALRVELTKWMSTTADTLNSWRERCVEAIERTAQSLEFRAVLGDHRDVAPDLEGLRMSSKRNARVVREPGRWMGLANRNVVYQMGKFFGAKFRPWGAVKMSAKISKVGAVLSVVAVGLDIVDWVRSEGRYKRIEQDRQKFARWLQESVSRVVKTIAFGDESEPGILMKLEVILSTLKTQGDHSKERKELELRICDEQSKIATYDELMSDASSRLGNPGEAQ